MLHACKKMEGSLRILVMPRPTSALIVDDEPHVHVYLKILLKQLGVTTIWDAAEDIRRWSWRPSTNPKSCFWISICRRSAGWNCSKS